MLFSIIIAIFDNNICTSFFQPIYKFIIDGPKSEIFSFPNALISLDISNNKIDSDYFDDILCALNGQVSKHDFVSLCYIGFYFLLFYFLYSTLQPLYFFVFNFITFFCLSYFYFLSFSPCFVYFSISVNYSTYFTIC